MPLVLITRLLTGQADIPVITTVRIKIPLNIKQHIKLNMITHRNSMLVYNNSSNAIHLDVHVGSNQISTL